MGRKLLHLLNGLITFTVVMMLIIGGAYSGYSLWDNQQVYDAAENVNSELREIRATMFTPTLSAMEQMIEENRLAREAKAAEAAQAAAVSTETTQPAAVVTPEGTPVTETAEPENEILQSVTEEPVITVASPVPETEAADQTSAAGDQTENVSPAAAQIAANVPSNVQGEDNTPAAPVQIVTGTPAARTDGAAMGADVLEQTTPQAASSALQVVGSVPSTVQSGTNAPAATVQVVADTTETVEVSARAEMPAASEVLAAAEMPVTTEESLEIVTPAAAVTAVTAKVTDGSAEIEMPPAAAQIALTGQSEATAPAETIQIVAETPAVVMGSAIADMPVASGTPVVTETPDTAEGQVIAETPAAVEMPTVTEVSVITGDPIVTENAVAATVTDAPAATATPAPAPAPTEEPDDSPFGQLKAINKDITAWLTMPGTAIDYPVLQGTTNYSYINTDVYGNFALAGSIFLDSRNSEDYSDIYSLLYGHNMSQHRMFSDINLYKEEEFFNQYTLGMLLMPDGCHILESLSIIVVPASDSGLFNPENWTYLDGEGIYRQVQENALYTCENGLEALREQIDSGMTPRLVALSTCSDEFTDARTILLTLMDP